MGKLITGSICVSDIQKDKLYKSEKTGKSYLNVTVWENDAADDYGNHFSVQQSSTKEEREVDGFKANYIGNLKRMDTSNNTSVPTDREDDLPF